MGGGCAARRTTGRVDACWARSKGRSWFVGWKRPSRPVAADESGCPLSGRCSPLEASQGCRRVASVLEARREIMIMRRGRAAVQL